jgi:hypothetical protein
MKVVVPALAGDQVKARAIAFVMLPPRRDHFDTWGLSRRGRAQHVRSSEMPDLTIASTVRSPNAAARSLRSRSAATEMPNATTEDMTTPETAGAA